MHDILNSAEQRHSSLVPRINELFGWEKPGESPHAPSPPLPSADALEAAQMFDQLPEVLRRAKIEELRATLAMIKKANDD